MSIIEVQNLSKNYGETKALREISFSIEKGELFGFIGPDGAGKTTLFRILNSLLLPDTGSARVNGLDAVDDYKKLRPLFGYMPGRFSLYQDLSVEENLQFFASVFGTSIDANYDLIEPVYKQLEPFKKRPAGKLSGGMKQKLALSCALIHRPLILLLDEPTTGVDAIARKDFWKMLQNLKKEGITIVVSTPYMDEARLCDRIALIQKGSILQIETPDRIIDSFQKPLFAVKTSQKYQAIQILRTYEWAESVHPFGDEIHYMDKREQGDPAALKDFLVEQGLSEVSVDPTKAGIEDCFMDLMQQKENSHE